MHGRTAFWAVILIAALSACGCQSGFSRIDRKVGEMVIQTSRDLGPDAYPPKVITPPPEGSRVSLSSPAANQRPETFNPPASEIPYRAIDEANDVLARLEAYAEPAQNALPLTLPAALAYATGHSREYRFAEEEYVLTALRLLIERHLWGPRFFNETTAQISGSGDDGMYDTALRLVNEFGVTQRLPYGGEVSARALATATEDLHQRVASEGVQDATIILQANLPLLRGAGLSAREPRIQAERNMIYAAREFEQFRREFFFDLTQDFLNLIVQQQSVENAELQVQGLEEVAAREQSLYEAGRTPLFQAALAQQSVVNALDTLNVRRENFRLAVDRFKVRLGMPLEQEIDIVPSGYELPLPHVDLDQAVVEAMAYRLDLQTGRDQVDDALRQVEVARNDLLPDLDVFGSVNVPTDRDRRRAGLDFAPGDSTFVTGVTFGLPLDREIERLGVRTAQIRLERERRQYQQERDLATIDVRSAVRDIDRARYTLEIQERSVAIGEQRKASIEAAPDRATARDASEANNELLRARDRRDSAARDLQVAILSYLLETGQLRVDRQGHLLPLRGMDVRVIGDAPVPDPNAVLDPADAIPVPANPIPDPNAVPDPNALPDAADQVPDPANPVPDAVPDPANAGN